MRLRLAALLPILAFLGIAARADEPASATPPPSTPAAAPKDEAAAAQPAPPHQATVAEIRARLLEHLNHKSDKAEAGPEKDAKKANPVPAAASPAPAKSAPAAAGQTEATRVLPKFEVRQMPITELDLKIAQQNREIAREKKNTEPTPLDETLNGKKVSHWFSFLGGQSSDQRATVAGERVYIMEQEKDLIEAIADAQTKEEKAELEKALADLRKTRRELEQSLR